ncbi:MAG: tRNA (guanosine(46)-N7)-methyltransferase TrmB [Phycisphaerae bacterium]
MTTVDDIIVAPPSDDAVLDPMAWFATPGPFEIEVGCGKGGFLLARARALPHVRLLGIEWANKYYRYCADRMARWQLTNVRVMRADAAHFIAHHLPPACVSVMHVYHPDPWPKKRHQKRRLFQPAFVAAAVRVLVPGGRLCVQSDHAPYFEHIRTVLVAHAELEPCAWAASGAVPDPAWTGTNFEIKYVRDGRSIYRLAVTRRPTGRIGREPPRDA